MKQIHLILNTYTPLYVLTQVAKEIWMCDNRTVSKFQGDIGDFKMQLRRQMQLTDG